MSDVTDTPTPIEDDELKAESPLAVITMRRPGAQHRERDNPVELLIEQGASSDPRGRTRPRRRSASFGDDRMILNLGPQHRRPTVLRLMSSSKARPSCVPSRSSDTSNRDGEDREELTYVQGTTNVTRMDYFSPLINELCYSLASRSSSNRDAPRATWIGC